MNREEIINDLKLWKADSNSMSANAKAERIMTKLLDNLAQDISFDATAFAKSVWPDGL